MNQKIEVNSQTTNNKILQPNESISQKTFEPKSILLKEDSIIHQLIIIHQGEIAYLEPSKNDYLLIAPVKNFILGFSYVVSEKPFPLKVITTKQSIVSAFPVSTSKGIQNIILGKLNIALMALNSMQKETTFGFNVFKKCEDYFSLLNNLVNNLSIIFFKFQPSLLNQVNKDDTVDKNLVRMKSIIDNFSEKNQIPKILNKNWLQQNQYIEDYFINFDYQEEIFEQSLLHYITALPIELQSNILKANLKILEIMSKKYYKIQQSLYHDLMNLISHIHLDIDFLMKGDYALTEKLNIILDLFDSKEMDIPPQELNDTLVYTKEKLEQLISGYNKTFYKKINPPAIYTKIKSKLESLNIERKDVKIKEETTKIEVIKDHQSVFEDLKSSAEKIMQYCEVPEQERLNVLKSLKGLRNLKNPLESDPDIRKLKKPVHDVYWKAYEKAFFKYRNSRGNVPKYISLFLLYGFFDENFLEPQHIVELYDLIDTTDSVNSEFSILTTIDWLNLIYEKKETPSINEVGQSYFEVLKQEHPTESKNIKKLEQFPPDIDSPEKRVNYEIKNFITSNSKLVSGSPTTYFAVLTKYHLIAPKIKDIFATKEKISQELKQLLEIDFSAYYREMVLNDEKKKIFKEFIMVNVFPHIILMPTAGNRSMMWQELEDYRKKDSPARFSFPIFCTGDIGNMIIEVTGAFRWEIQKTILGHDYNNVAVPSLTSEFLDYVQFYHKNRELSDEQKEKIKQDFKNLRDDRSKFVNDYLIWIKYESQGILKLNRVVRNIFYRYIPFSKGIRENLSKQPAYAEIHNRFKNIRTKKVIELENRWKKYGTKETWPASLRLTYDYYSL